MKLGVLGYFGYSNTGDEAILHCFLTELAKIAPDVKVTVFAGDPEATEALHHVHAVHSVIPTTLERMAVGVLGRRRRLFFACIKAILDMDILVIGGGGLFFDSPSTLNPLVTLLKITRWCKRLGKKVVYLGVDVGPVHHQESIRMFRQILPMVDLVCVRSRESLQLLKEHNIEVNNVKVTADFVLLMQPCEPGDARKLLASAGLMKERKYVIGICLNGELIENERINVAIEVFCRNILGRGDTELWFFPMQTRGGFDDRLVADKVISRLPKDGAIKSISEGHAPWQTMGMMREVLDAVVSVRLHGSILALAGGLPAFGISYMPKVARLFKELDHPEWQCDLAELSPGRLIDGFAKIWDERDEIRSELQAILLPLQQRARLNIELFSEKFLLRESKTTQN